MMSIQTWLNKRHERSFHYGNEPSCFVSNAKVCETIDKITEENFGKCKDTRFGFSMSYWKAMKHNADSIYDLSYQAIRCYDAYLTRMFYYNKQRIAKGLEPLAVYKPQEVA